MRRHRPEIPFEFTMLSNRVCDQAERCLTMSPHAAPSLFTAAHRELVSTVVACAKSAGLDAAELPMQLGESRTTSHESRPGSGGLIW